MKLFDILKNKETKELIQIDSFATRMNTNNDLLIVFRRIAELGDFSIGSSPSFNGYGTKEEIEKEYELLVSSDDLDKYENWEDIYKLV